MTNQVQIHFPLLNHERYLAAQDRAIGAIRSRAQAPDWEHFKHTAVRAHPKWFTGAILVSLALVLIFSFTISAGKQVAANALIFDNLPDKFNHLSPLWASTSIAFMLLLSEVGSILFLIAAGTIGSHAPTWRGVNLTAWAFRLFALLCAAYAVTSNVSVTLLDPVKAVGVLQWMISIGVPITVLGLGILLERLTVDGLQAANKRKVAFDEAQRDYQALIASPEKHTAYPAILADQIWQELLRLKATREIVEPLYESDPRRKKWIVKAEYQAQAELNNFDLEAGDMPSFLSLGQEPPLLN